ncbi:hypothetical protein U1839_04485 [Sphingomonas sp. RT2P30]|uniref:hypothetical protein n=1 Tax=Parasphingomonas halimpatiens TaxID=3096162 RepID=UPI002FC9EE53
MSPDTELHFISRTFQPQNEPAHSSETFRDGRAYFRRPIEGGERTMKNAASLIFALIPLIAVVGACVAVP